MCRLLGITNFDYCKHQHLVRNFCELARTGMVMAGDPAGHEDGWGLAFYRDGQLAVLKSGVNLVEETDRVLDALSGTGTSPVVILHLRKSSWRDTTCTRHAHPFDYDNIAFAHNGTVYDYQRLVPDIRIPALGADALDTEVFFYHFMSADGHDLGRAFLDTVALIKRECTFSALNCLFSTGDTLFAYRDYSREPDYYSLYQARREDSCFVSSQPLDDNLRWDMLGKEELVVIQV